MAHTFDDLVEKQRDADQAQGEVERLRGEYGPPTARQWNERQTEVYEQAWRDWHGLAADVQGAITKYAKDEGQARNDVEADVKKAARHPELASA
ncbi:hypothetical protein ACIRH0_03915 [Streptomyces sp. NPDC093675]|uniref:hypothetical protein n=1 Tax=Streptomyces sp. NPDC093675 TaxID=3366049 RepID=UPI0038182188